MRDSPNLIGAEVDDIEPSADRVRSHLASLADAFGLPRRLVQATVQTETGFDPQTVRAGSLPPYSALHEFEPAARAYGPMRVSDEHIGETVGHAAGKPFQIAEDIKTDWKANARAGVALLAQQYQLAELESPFGSLEEWAQQAYSGYSAGAPLRGRYLSTLADDLPAHPRDRAFLRKFRKFRFQRGSEDKQAEAPNAQQSSALQQPQNQRASEPPGSAPLPGPLQRLKEDPGNLFLRSPAPSDEQGAPRLSDRGIDLVPSLSNVPLRTRSLGDMASLLSSREGTAQPAGGRPLPGPLERLKENPRNLFLEPFARGQYFSQINLIIISENEGGNWLTPYFPGDPKDHPNAGVTIGKGVDLGQHNADEFRKIGVPQSLIDKLEPFFDKRGQSAVHARNEVLKRDPSFSISGREADQLNRAVMMSKFNEVGKAYNDASPISKFADLPWQAQTVIADLWYNMGGGRPGRTRGLQNTRFWEQVTSGKWQEAYNNLREFAPNQPDDSPLNVRAWKDAQLLKQALDAGTLPKP